MNYFKMKIILSMLFIKNFSFATEEQNIDDIINNDPLTRQRCKSNEFDCGHDCIDSNLICDGKADCPNGIDEYNEYCVIDHKNASCSYPNVPPQRYDFSLNYSSKTKGSVPEFVQGVFKCKPGYFGGSVNEMVSRCFQRSWDPPIMLCKKTCPEINNSELEQTCFQGGKVDCNGIIWEHTMVRFDCRKVYHKPTIKAALCLPNGKWNLDPNRIECHPMCGYLSTETVQLLNRKDFPWRVIIREQIDSTTHYFSGTLIDTKLVLTDGDLFTRSKDSNDFAILVNDDIDSWGPQKSYEVKRIHFLPKHYQKFLSPDSLGNLAILECYEEIEFGLTVSPVCIYPFSYPATLELFNSTGLMIALGDSEEQINRDEIFPLLLKSSQGICKKNRERCNQYFGQLNNMSEKELRINSVNQGTGLIKVDKELKLYFLEGVYSGQDAESNLPIFTFASDYIEWIDEIRERTKHNNDVIFKNENTSIEFVNQLEDTTQTHTASFKLFTMFVLLPFVILIVVLFTYHIHVKTISKIQRI